MDYDTTKEKITILDCGSQFTHLIAKKVRDLGVYAEILPPETRASSLFGRSRGIIISGGPSSVYAHKAPTVDPNIFEIDVPVLGICYGHQLISHLLKGKVKKGERGEYGKSILTLNEPSRLFKGVKQESTVWMSHFDSVVRPPWGFVQTASSTQCDIAALENKKKHIYSVQFHPEVTHSEYGEQVISNFLFDICSVQKTWSLDQYFDKVREDTLEKVGDKNVFVLLSGGVDSLVAFVLLNEILGKDRVFGLHVNTGFMRLNESDEIKKAVQDLGYTNIQVVDASQKFFSELKKSVEPEEKRKIAGRVFVEVFNESVEKLYLDSHNWLLGQGTIYPDTIESGRTKHSETIKTHHNRVAEIEKLIAEGRVVEPLEKLYKDDVRKLGERLGIPKELVWRHPFPGPGLAIMTLCSDEELAGNAVELAPKEVQIIEDILMETSFDYAVAPLKSVGVQGDERTYAHPLILMGEGDYTQLDEIATKIPNSLKKINRIIWAISPEKIQQFHIKKSYMTPQRIAVLQKAHDVANEILRKHDLYNDVWEMPVVLIPLSIKGGESIVLRPLTSENVMTVSFYRMNRNVLAEMAEEIKKIPGVDAVFYDITNKPPATVQWE